MGSRTLEDAYAYAAELQSKAVAKASRYIRRDQLRLIVPLANTTIYEMEQRKEFPRRIYLTPRTPVWDLAEVEAWVKERRAATESGNIEKPSIDNRKRKWRPVRKAK